MLFLSIVSTLLVPEIISDSCGQYFKRKKCVFEDVLPIPFKLDFSFFLNLCAMIQLFSEKVPSVTYDCCCLFGTYTSLIVNLEIFKEI